jgi:hypothetical protein
MVSGILQKPNLLIYNWVYCLSGMRARGKVAPEQVRKQAGKVNLASHVCQLIGAPWMCPCITRTRWFQTSSWNVCVDENSRCWAE